MFIKNKLPIIALVFLLCFTSVSAFAEIKVELTKAPNVPKPLNRNGGKTVILKLEAKEFVGDIADGKKYNFWSFGGSVPGPMARVRVGDTVQFHLSNAKSNTQPHNIDIHAVNGPGGGAAINTVAPGESKVFSFKTLNPGLYIYHCAAGAIVDAISD